MRIHQCPLTLPLSTSLTPALGHAPDLGTMSSALGSCSDLRAAIQHILAERLKRYLLQATPEKNDDARSSVALFLYL